MKIITAKFKGTCATTGRTIAKGDVCLYDPKTKTVHRMDSQTVPEPRNDDAAMVQAQEDAAFDNFCQTNNI